MAEKKKYNSILVSGRKDETLTYSRYVKDEESGESVKESLDKKVNNTDELETQQIKDGAITNEKLAADSVGNTNMQDGSVSNEKLEDGSVTNEKLAENSITKDKLKDNTIGVEKLDPELRQTINAATGLPENLVEIIQNVDDTLKDHQSQLNDKQSQIDDKQQQITANDEDISLLQTRSTQMEETIKSIAATGGASQATSVTYNNTNSQLSATNIQSAVDELQGSKIDKTSIAQESGDAEDKVMSQKTVSDKFSDLPSRPYTTNSVVNKGIIYLYIDKSKYSGDLDLSDMNVRTISRNYNNQWIIGFEDSKTQTVLGSINFENGATQGSTIYRNIYYYACIDWSVYNEGIVNLVHAKLNDIAYIENPKFFLDNAIVQTIGTSTNKVMSQKVVSEEISQIKKYTESPLVNKAIISLYIDVSNYTGSLDLSSINVRTITRNQNNVWLISFEDTSSQTAFCSIEFKDGVSQGIAEKDGVKAYACINWAVLPDGKVNLVHAKLNDVAYVENPKFFLKDTTTQELNSVLYGKKLASIGDSITEGLMADNISLSDYYPISGSKKETFTYVIAKKYGMKWYNYGKSGSTMGDIFAIGADRNGFSKADGRYTKMAKDIDYLIIMFGTNDSDYGAWMKAEEYIQNKYGTYKMFPAKGHSVGEDGVMTQEEYQEVISYSGEINGIEYTGIDYWRHLYIGDINDNTNKTWCGAWNIVLEYLLINYKRSKIIIWLNPTNYNFDDSTIKLAEKWGITYINMHDINTPTIWARKEQENTLIGGVKMNSFVKDRGITKLDIYTADGLHPNSNGYDRISDVIAGHLLNI